MSQSQSDYFTMSDSLTGEAAPVQFLAADAACAAHEADRGRGVQECGAPGAGTDRMGTAQITGWLRDLMEKQNTRKIT